MTEIRELASPAEDEMTVEQYLDSKKKAIVDRIYRRGSTKYKPSEAPGASVNQRADESLLRRIIPEAGKAEQAGTVNLTLVQIYHNSPQPEIEKTPQDAGHDNVT